MQTLYRYWQDYRPWLTPRVLVPTLLLLLLLIIINYTGGLDEAIQKKKSWPVKLLMNYGVGLAAYGIPWLLYYHYQRGPLAKRVFSSGFWWMIVCAPFLFSLKMSVPLPRWVQGADALYWNKVLYWPVLMLGLLICLAVWWRLQTRQTGLPGWTAAREKQIPYKGLLLLMIPAVAWAATRSDFLQLYPRLQWVVGLEELKEWPAWKIILFEGAYGCDFVSIELFFRGFLVIALARYAGPAVILPMASYYCVIHFGKPWPECVSALGGGLLLGMIAWRTGSVFGGLALHLGLAWMMEAAGYAGHFIK